jgi:hypothetical protein
MKQILAAALLLAIAGCTNQHLGKSEGRPFPLNPGLWTPTQADMDVGETE